MGRVSKYKKVKDTSGFGFGDTSANRSKGFGRRSKKSKASFDTAPSKKDQDDFYFDEKGNIVDKVEKKKKKKETKKKGDIFDEVWEEYGSEKMKSLQGSMDKKSMGKVLAAGGGGEGKRRRAGGAGEAADSATTSSSTTTISKPNGPLFEPKQDHESMRAFNRRIKEQTRIALKEDMDVLGTSARRKAHLSEKKKQKKLKRKGPQNNDSDSEDGGRWGKKAKTGADEVEFGEQAERPPELTVRPKMRKKKVVEVRRRNGEERSYEH
ncbi:hypothetical protein TL16_g06518 [Triparma laevis f. inornata]|uniref:Uncharacterized protein n=2 Tax=Triparma laevis TaxID=1534972 RepID=A0A9W7EEY5_9STRA|nr:hypothetical protein TL16_g06518 [Triparma laevis f. inornata]GMH78709.1 hypothetical protein TrLO_g1455 [Triparma laevis f. longispina]